MMGRRRVRKPELRVGPAAMPCAASGIWRRMGHSAEPRECGSPASFRCLGDWAEGGKSFPENVQTMATPLAGAEVDRGVKVELRGDIENKRASGGCHPWRVRSHLLATQAWDLEGYSTVEASPCQQAELAVLQTLTP
jgi:hypothetical protein